MRDVIVIVYPTMYLMRGVIGNYAHICMHKMPRVVEPRRAQRGRGGGVEGRAADSGNARRRSIIRIQPNTGGIIEGLLLIQYIHYYDDYVNLLLTDPGPHRRTRQ